MCKNLALLYADPPKSRLAVSIPLDESRLFELSELHFCGVAALVFVN